MTLCHARTPSVPPCTIVITNVRVQNNADGDSSLGVLLNGLFTFNMTSGSRIIPRLALGLAIVWIDQLPGQAYHPLDGVLGLGKGKASIVSQLHSKCLVRNVVGHCLSGRGGGFLFFGDEVYDSSRIVWTPMAHDRMKHYSAGSGELIFGGKGTGYKNLFVVFDSGSSFSYLNSHTYQGFISLLKKELNGKPLRETKDDYTLPLCWKGRRPSKTINDVKKYFKHFALSFANGWKSKAHFEIPPESYLTISVRYSTLLEV
ncbi:hypothetical protein RND71_030730 [Anisodus tanguticus]|uniref:Xylanase inhibitor N-terminal domain-containing protein n=1 Tax=Anisodus tanguticus TaxID=243964 RepID=A0AAE1RI85_9SOLA|nr:hypothetical protein RND71_030730 [Anisodus tanguticus]